MRNNSKLLAKVYILLVLLLAFSGDCLCIRLDTCVLGLRPSALFNEMNFLLKGKKEPAWKKKGISSKPFLLSINPLACNSKAISFIVFPHTETNCFNLNPSTGKGCMCSD
jgi:hypothetical protein